MSLVDLILPSWVKPLMIALTLAAVVGTWLWYRALLIEDGRQQMREEYALAAAAQATDNRERARVVEIKYVDREVVRTRTLTKIEKELPNATTNLAACLLSDDAVSLLNDAASAVKD